MDTIDTRFALLSDYCKSHYNDLNTQEYKVSIDKWDKYRKKIIDNTLELANYVGDNNDEGMTHWLAYDKTFVQLTQALPHRMISLKDGKYNVDDDYKIEGSFSEADNSDKAQACLDKFILPLLQLIVGAFIDYDNKNGEGIFSNKSKYISFFVETLEKYDLKKALEGVLNDTDKLGAFMKNLEEKAPNVCQSLKTKLVELTEKYVTPETYLKVNLTNEAFTDYLKTDLKKDTDFVKDLKNKLNENQKLKDDLKKELKDVLEDNQKLIDAIMDELTSETATLNDMLKKHMENLIPAAKKYISIESKTPLDWLSLIQRSKLYNDYSAKALLIKIMNIESARDDCCPDLKNKLVNIANEGNIDKLYKDLVESTKPVSDATIVEKSYAVMTAAYDNENMNAIKGEDLEKQMKIYRTLWDYSDGGHLGISEETPNVIFYGSPGTGKTYTVNKGIDLILVTEENAVNAISDGKVKIDSIKAERVVSVQCHPGFGYEEFIEGIKPLGITESGAVKLGIVNGLFKDLCIKARDNVGGEYFFIADEINRANLSAMFGETLSLLEYDYRDDPTQPDKRHTTKTPLSTTMQSYINDNLYLLKKNKTSIFDDCKAEDNKIDIKQIVDKIKNMVYDCKLVIKDKAGIEQFSEVLGATKSSDLADLAKNNSTIFNTKQKPDSYSISVQDISFGVPKNIRFIGMMNDVDKSIDSFDLALRRRFKWLRKDCDYDILKEQVYKIDKLPDDPSKKKQTVDAYVSACKSLNDYISKDLGFGQAYEFGHAYFMKIKNYFSNESNRSEITSTKRESLFDEHLKPVLTEYIRSFKGENDIEKVIKEARTKFTKDESSVEFDEDALFALIKQKNGNVEDINVKNYCKICKDLLDYIAKPGGRGRASGLGLDKEDYQMINNDIFVQITEYIGSDNTINNVACNDLFVKEIEADLKNAYKEKYKREITNTNLNKARNKIFVITKNNT